MIQNSVHVVQLSVVNTGVKEMVEGVICEPAGEDFWLQLFVGANHCARRWAGFEYEGSQVRTDRRMIQERLASDGWLR